MEIEGLKVEETEETETKGDKQSLTKKENVLQIVKFVLFSASAGIIQLIVFTILNEFLFIGNYWPSYLIALTMSVIYNFTINRRFTFKSANNVPKAMFLAFLFYVPFAPYTTWLTDYLAKEQNWNEYLVVLINMVQNLILEFLWWRFFIYRNSINSRTKKPKNA